MRKKEVCFIVNPFSGINRKHHLDRLLRQRLDLKQYNYKIFYTEYAGHAIELSRQAVQQGFDLIVAVGGDGSVNEVAQGLIGTEVVMGILPAGSGNGFATDLGIGRQILPAIEVINRAAVRTIDTCWVNNRPFVNIAGVGFSALVAHRIKNSKIRGMLSYLWFMLGATLPYRANSYEVVIDGKTLRGKYLLIEVANGPMYGYNFVVAAQAKLDDGRLEVVLIKRANKFRYLLSSWRFLTRSVHKSQLVENFEAKEVIIHCRGRHYFHLDGDGFEVRDEALRFSINPMSLRVCVPA